MSFCAVAATDAPPELCQIGSRQQYLRLISNNVGEWSGARE
jgi:hypothetical protein